MDHHYGEIPNGKMPRASKRGRKSQGETVASRGRRTRASTLAEMMQNNPAYGAQAQMSDHATGYPRTDSESTQHNMLRTQLAAPYQRQQVRPPAEHPERPSSRYYTRAQVNERASTYVRTDQNMDQSTANQILYPNMVPRTTATYTVPEQLPQLSTVTEHTVGSRYNTRSAVHNLPLATAPTIERYWNSNDARAPRTPVSAVSGATAAHQMKSPQPAHIAPPQIKNNTTQTELSLADAEIKLIKLLRSKRMDPNNINVIIEKDDYVVTYDQPEKGNSGISPETYASIEKNSDHFKNLVALYCTPRSHNQPGHQTEELNIPALEYPSQQESASTGSAENSPNNQSNQMPLMTACGLQTIQQALNQRRFLEEIAEESSHANNAFTSNAEDLSPAESQAPQQSTQSPNMEASFPIPNIVNQHFNHPNNYNRFMHHGQGGGHRGRMGPHFNQSQHPNFNFPYHFLQNFQFPNMFMDPRFLPRSSRHDPDQYGMNGWQ